MARPTSRKPKEARLGSLAVKEAFRLAQLQELRREIEAWARKKDLWHDASFQIPFLFEDDMPQRGDVLLLSSEGPLYSVFNSDHYENDALFEEFCTLLETKGFWCERKDHLSVVIIPVNDVDTDEFLAVYRWQWIQEMARERFLSLHSEVFEHFGSHPGDLARLTWRQYEELLDAIFRNQGFRTKLGPGMNDAGVDIRLYQSQAIPELVTLVQAKRYARRPIGLDAVAALFGNVVEQRASRGILATTSHFQPRARKFAGSVSQAIDLPSIDLIDSNEVGGWCIEIANCLNAFFEAGGVSEPPFLAQQTKSNLVGKIVVASYGYNMTSNQFCVIEADFPHEVILRTIESDGNDQCGTELPILNGIRESKRFVAYKRTAGGISFRADKKSFSVWDGKPQYYNYVD
ncbi:MAG TPA: restriction endonuclease [Bryobacteraceae bacterium]|nr:restriction endonuclease [Bryobacteraceae bacterium]